MAGYQAHAHIGGGTLGYVYGAEWTRTQPSLRQPLATKLLHKTSKFVKASADSRENLLFLTYLDEHANIIGLIA